MSSIDSRPISLGERWQEVQRRIVAAAERSGRDPAAVRVVAVTKMVAPALVREALELGLTDLGENRVQEGLAKQTVLGRGAARWHLIGSLQTNKARRAALAFDLIHSLDRLELAQMLARIGAELGRPISVLVQVNLSGEATKHGLQPEEMRPLVEHLAGLQSLRPSGLMTMAPLVADPEETRPIFRRAKELFDRLAEEVPLGTWQWLSMGMSQDFEVAVEEGANLVRIGTAIFGERQLAGR